MDYKEPKKRVTKNDKKNKKEVYSQKYIRNKLKVLEKARDEDLLHVHTQQPGHRVCESQQIRLQTISRDLPGVEVVYYAFQNFKGQEVKDRFIDPRIKFYDAMELDPVSPRGFGDQGIVPAIIKEKAGCSLSLQ
jgi:hypothetical protein